jgi:short-subunit dehydrogenase
MLMYLKNSLFQFTNYSIEKIIALREKEVFKYLTYIGYLCIANVVFNYLIDIKDYFLSSFNNFHIKYGKGWVIVTQACDPRIRQILTYFLQNGYKVLLIGNDEDMILSNISPVLEKLKGEKISYEKFIYDFYRTDVLNANDFEYFNSKLKEITNNEPISLIIHNCNFRVNKYFDKLNDSEINLLVNSNLISTILICKFINDYNSKKSTLFVYFSDILSDLMIPHMQLYSTYLNYSKFLISKLSKNIDKCIIEDALYTENQIQIEKLNSGLIYKNYKNKFLKDITTNTFFLKFYYRYYLKINI